MAMFSASVKRDPVSLLRFLVFLKCNLIHCFSYYFRFLVFVFLFLLMLPMLLIAAEMIVSVPFFKYVLRVSYKVFFPSVRFLLQNMVTKFRGYQISDVMYFDFFNNR